MLRPWSARALGGLVSGFLVVVSVLALGWHLDGGRWYDVATPSMGRTAPVGSLLLTRPVAMRDIAVGDVVTFRSPGGFVYTHRVIAKTDRGLQTKGDINPVPDAWRIPESLVIGRVAWVLPGLGWVLAGFPLVLIGSGIIWLTSAVQKPDTRAVVRLVGVPVAISISMLVLHPFVGVARLGTTQQADRVSLTTVSTGLLPIRLEPFDVHTIHVPRHVVTGEVADVVVRTLHPGRQVRIDAAPDLTWLELLALALLVLSPLLLALVVGLPPRERLHEELA